MRPRITSGRNPYTFSITSLFALKSAIFSFFQQEKLIIFVSHRVTETHIRGSCSNHRHADNELVRNIPFFTWANRSSTSCSAKLIADLHHTSFIGRAKKTEQHPAAAYNKRSRSAQLIRFTEDGRVIAPYVFQRSETRFVSDVQREKSSTLLIVPQRSDALRQRGLCDQLLLGDPFWRASPPYHRERITHRTATETLNGFNAGKDYGGGKSLLPCCAGLPHLRCGRVPVRIYASCSAAQSSSTADLYMQVAEAMHEYAICAASSGQSLFSTERIRRVPSRKPDAANDDPSLVTDCSAHWPRTYELQRKLKASLIAPIGEAV